MDKQAVIEQLQRAVKATGKQKAYATIHDISEQYLSDVLAGRREPGAKILNALNLKRNYARKGK